MYKFAINRCKIFNFYLILEFVLHVNSRVRHILSLLQLVNLLSKCGNIKSIKLFVFTWPPVDIVNENQPGDVTVTKPEVDNILGGSMSGEWGGREIIWQLNMMAELHSCYTTEDLLELFRGWLLNVNSSLSRLTHIVKFFQISPNSQRF